MNITKINNTFEVENNGQIYVVELNPINCTCPHFKYRNFRSGEFCKHIKEVIRFLGEKD